MINFIGFKNELRVFEFDCNEFCNDNFNTLYSQDYRPKNIQMVRTHHNDILEEKERMVMVKCIDKDILHIVDLDLKMKYIFKSISACKNPDAILHNVLGVVIKHVDIYGVTYIYDKLMKNIYK
jgi:hypothetical protein